MNLGTISAGAAALLAIASPAAQQAIFRARTDVVAIDTTVFDKRAPVAGLTSQDFTVRDNGVPQTILDFTRERQPLDVTLTIDVSGSMAGAKRAAVERAIGQIEATLGPRDRVAVVTFGTHVAEVASLSAPPIGVTLGTVGGGTSVLDALLLSLVTAPVAGRRQLNVFLTDGNEVDSQFNDDTIRATAAYTSSQFSFVLTRRSGLNLYSARYGETSSTLRAVAAATGGDVVTLDSDESLAATFLSTIDAFRSSYVLRFVPTGVNTPGWHDVSVTVRNRNYTVRARRGYWAADK